MTCVPRHLAACGLALAACGRSAPAPSPGQGPPPGSGAWVTGYDVGYQNDLYQPAQIDFGAITHLLVGTVIPKADGTLDAVKAAFLQ